MPKTRKNELIQSAHFRWLLGERNGVFFADGRSNRSNVGRHSLGTRDRAEALSLLGRLDLFKAVEFGLADRRLLDEEVDATVLSLEKGRELYESHVRRPRVTGGAKPKTLQRYKAVLDKFLAFAKSKGITSWNGVTRRVLEQYAGHLDAEEYAPRTEYLELTALKQIIKWLVAEKLLPSACQFTMPLDRPRGTDAFCYRAEHVRAMIDHCRTKPGLMFLADIITALACTGLRISELASLRWTDVDLETDTVSLTDESSRAPRRTKGKERETKTGQSRSLPIHADFRSVLEQLPRSKDGLLFHGPKGAQLKPDTIRNILLREVLTPLAKRFPTPKGEIGLEDGRLHSFRHYFCSICANSGVAEHVVMTWLGHRDSKMVRHYYHLHAEESQRQMGRLNFLGSAGGAVADGEVRGLCQEVVAAENRPEKS